MRAPLALAGLAGVGVVVGGCSSTGVFHDPVFQSVGEPVVAAGPCPSERTCLEVLAQALPEAVGETGECALYERPGGGRAIVTADVEVPDVAPAGSSIPVRWVVEVDGDVAVDDLYAVCEPTIEG